MRFAKYFSTAAVLVSLVAALAMVGCPATPGGPQADFEADVTSGPVPLEVQFTDLSNPGLGTIKSWVWTFGDGTTRTQQDPPHIYEDPGTYKVSLMVTTEIAADYTAKAGYITVTGAEGEGEGEGEDDAETVMLPNSVELEMVRIPSGDFMMGRNTSEQDSNSDEAPQHQVSAPAFWMSKYEVTKRQWQAVMNTTPWSAHDYISDNLDSPAVWVSWNEVKAFITALNDYTDKTFRLPSEAEWEYACRAETTTRYYWGNDSSYTDIDDNAWWYDVVWDTGDLYARVVGLMPDNDYGLYDMSGNVWEYCEDDYHATYASAPATGAAWVDSPRATQRVLRGGGWYDSTAAACRSANRFYTGPTNKACDHGFRLAR